MLNTKLATVGVSAAALLAAVDRAHAKDPDWSVAAPGTITAQEAGVPAGASAPRLARAAIQRSAKELRLGRHGGLRLVADRKAPTAANDGSVRQLRFVQTVGGLRVLWSHLSTDVAGDEVRGISGSSVRLPSDRLLGRRKLTRAAATRIAKRSSAGKEHALPAEPVAYAGSPGQPRAARRAYVVQIRPAVQSDSENPKTVCVVVDAESGKILARWDGRAARSLESRQDPDDRPGAKARAAGAQDVILQAVDARGTNAVTTAHYRDIWTLGSPFGGGGTSTTTFGAPSTSALAATVPSALDITRGHWCLVRGMCGRYMGFNGVYNRWFMTVNTPAGTTRYESQYERIFIEPARANDQVIAHEVGHHLDHQLSPDALETFEARETYEGIADMYAYDYVRERTLGLGSEIPISQSLANPGDFEQIDGDDYPAHMNAYCRRPGRDVHLNGRILAHAYHRIVGRLGHHTAGHMLPHMSWRLPVKRTFGSVRVAFSQAAAVFYGQGSTVQQAVERSFDEVGVTPFTVAPGNVQTNCS